MKVSPNTDYQAERASHTCPNVLKFHFQIFPSCAKIENIRTTVLYLDCRNQDDQLKAAKKCRQFIAASPNFCNLVMVYPEDVIST